MDVLVVVPARGGSKGLPRKNARVLGDLPLLGWTAEAIAASCLARSGALLSTDDAEIAEIGRRSGLEVPFMRPPELAGDTASAQSVALHALDWMERERKRRADAVMWLQPTSPFRPPRALDAAVEAMADGAVPAVVGVKPIYRSFATLFHADSDFVLSAVDGGAAAASRRQDAAPFYTPNGALYLVSSAVLRAQGTFFPAGARGLAMDQIESIDIDDAADWAIAEAIAAHGAAWRPGR